MEGDDNINPSTPSKTSVKYNKYKATVSSIKIKKEIAVRFREYQESTNNTKDPSTALEQLLDAVGIIKQLKKEKGKLKKEKAELQSIINQNEAHCFQVSIYIVCMREEWLCVYV